MALTTLEQNTIFAGATAAKKLIADLKSALDQLNVIYDGTGGAKTTITQANMDLVPALSGLTKQQLDDGMFALTSTIKGNLVSAYSQLAILAARAF